MRKPRRTFDGFRHYCALCGYDIIIGRAKVGRVVFPGGVCYHCYKKHHKEKFK